MLKTKKSETDLRKMIKIIEELLKIEKTKRYLFHMRNNPKKEQKEKKDI